MSDSGPAGGTPPPASVPAKPASPFSPHYKPTGDHAAPLLGFFGSLLLHFRRAFSLKLRSYRLLDSETSALDALDPPVKSAEYRGLLLWRKSLIYVCGVLIVPTLLLGSLKFLHSFAKTGEQIDRAKKAGVFGARVVDAFEAVQGYQAFGFILYFITGAIFAICVWIAYRRWTGWQRSRQVLFWAWLAYFLTPFAMALIPVRLLLEDAGVAKPMIAAVGLGFGLNAFVQLGPKALSLMPGVLRASITTKVLFPGASAPGWLVTLAAPLYALMFFVILAVPHQIAGNFPLFLAICGFVGAPLWLWKSGYRLARPMAEEEAMREVMRARVVYMVLNVVGLAFFVGAFSEMLERLSLNGWDILHLLLNFMTTLLILSVIVTDLLIRSVAVNKQMSLDAEATEPLQAFELALWDFVDEQKHDAQRDAARAPAETTDAPKKRSPFG
ncbi:MAG: hypothetical protein KC609_11545 [Myxococcales bacterium]|nr:hypothetical protein [Myxococcales bacterium]